MYENYNSTNFFAETFIINLHSQDFSNEEDNILKLNYPDWFILKPAVGHGGEGIKVIKNITHF